MNNKNTSMSFLEYLKNAPREECCNEEKIKKCMKEFLKLGDTKGLIIYKNEEDNHNGK